MTASATNTHSTQQELRFGIEGMSCASCVSHIEKALNAVEGVSKVSVNLATETAQITLAKAVPSEQLSAAVENAGYHVSTNTVRLKIGGMSCNIRWGLLYGVLLCNARAMGEFGAVSVVSGHIRGETNTLPLHVEILYNEYNFAAAFAMASILACLALVTLAIKAVLEKAHGLKH